MSEKNGSSNGTGKAKALGINHVVLEVGDLDEAFEFYGLIFDIKVRTSERFPDGRFRDESGNELSLFVDLGDQFLQFTKNNVPAPDALRHFGLVVDDREPVRQALAELGVDLLDWGLNFRDPWGNRVEVVPYDDIQFTKASHVLDGMGVGGLKKTDGAIAELAEKGMAP
jgi:lactoylglutathione lyase